ncbi:TRAP transporter small permease [Bacillaceae bacterium SIJ1]|uniref:TRAP transporter small permease n=1 Tax=Litoribacterium kuwaitense TaxID=1398745 RepID=UPI0013ED5203|nr:TRAP transporter small permease [Litoribacterium kuwaitense]NGP45117.1 TRAP transporter small permease [Litoribacterium kuwaitense]
MVDKIKLILDRTILGVTSLFTFVLVAGALWQVTSRYVLGAPSTVTGELLRFLLVWTAILGATYAFGTNQHLAITFLKEKFKGKSRLSIRIINDLIILAFAILIMFKGGIEVVSITMSQTTPILNIPMGYVYSILPISGILIVIYKLLLLKEYQQEMQQREEV